MNPVKIHQQLKQVCMITRINRILRTHELRAIYAPETRSRQFFLAKAASSELRYYNDC